MPRLGRRAALAVAAAVTVVLALAGCSLVGSGPKPTAHGTASSALDALVPNYGGTLTVENAKKNTVQAADAIQGLIATSDVVHVDDQSKLVAATTSTGSFYGVERAITLTKGFDVILQAQAMEKLLVQAGWVSRQSTTTTAGYSAALSTATSVGPAVLLLQGDETPGAPPAILIEVESPDLPKK